LKFICVIMGVYNNNECVKGMEEVDVKSKKRRPRRKALSMDLGSEEDLRAFKKKKGDKLCDRSL